MGKLFNSFLNEGDSNYYIDQLKNKKLRLMDIPTEDWTRDVLVASIEYTGYQALNTMNENLLDYEMCLLAIKTDAGSCFKYIPEKFCTEELQILAVTDFCTVICDIKKPSKEVCIAAMESAIRQNCSNHSVVLDSVDKTIFPVKEWPLHWFPYVYNVENKRQFIREHGAKIFKQLDNLKLIEEDKEYCLVRYHLKKSDEQANRALIYRCPTSKDTYFTEVPKGINTIKEALNFMNNGVDKEEFVTES